MEVPPTGSVEVRGFTVSTGASDGSWFSAVGNAVVDTSADEGNAAADDSGTDSGTTLSMNPGMNCSILSRVTCHSSPSFRGSSARGANMPAVCITRIAFLIDSCTASDWATRFSTSISYSISHEGG
jgi:hypothetical protein